MSRAMAIVAQRDGTLNHDAAVELIEVVDYFVKRTDFIRLHVPSLFPLPEASEKTDRIL